MRKVAFLLAITSVMLCACSSGQEKTNDSVMKHMKMTAGLEDSIKIMYWSPVDSAYGTKYFSENDRDTLAKTMGDVAAILKTGAEKMKTSGKPDRYIISLAQRQMAGTARVGNIIAEEIPKGKFSGWKVHVNYQSYRKTSGTYRAQRWYIVDKDGESIIQYFEIPLP